MSRPLAAFSVFTAIRAGRFTPPGTSFSKP